MQSIAFDEIEVRSHWRTGESGSQHGQATRTDFIKDFTFVEQIHTVNMRFDFTENCDIHLKDLLKISTCSPEGTGDFQRVQRIILLVCFKPCLRCQILSVVR